MVEKILQVACDKFQLYCLVGMALSLLICIVLTIIYESSLGKLHKYNTGCFDFVLSYCGFYSFVFGTGLLFSGKGVHGGVSSTVLACIFPEHERSKAKFNGSFSWRELHLMWESSLSLKLSVKKCKLSKCSNVAHKHHFFLLAAVNFLLM